MSCERPSAFLGRTFESSYLISRGTAMRCTSRPATCSPFSPIPTLPTLPSLPGGGLGRARAAAGRGLLFSFFYRKSAVFLPDPLAHIVTEYLCKPRFHRREHQEGSMRYILVNVPRGCGWATQTNPMCHRTSKLKDDDVHLLRDYSGVHCRNVCVVAPHGVDLQVPLCLL